MTGARHWPAQGSGSPPPRMRLPWPARCSGGSPWPRAGRPSVPRQLALLLLSLATTLPLGLLWARPAVAAVIISAATVLSLSAYAALTVAGLIAQLAVLYRLGRGGSSVLAAGLATAFLVLALADPGQGGARIFTVLLAALAPVAAWAGIARRA